MPYQAGDTKNINGLTYVRDATGNWTAQQGSDVPQVVVPKAPAPQTPEQKQADALAVTEHEQKIREWNATHNPDGTEKPKTPQMTPQQLAAIREDALGKVNQVRTIRRMLKDGGVRQGDFIPETGGLGFLISKTGYGNASDIAARAETLKSGAALTEIQKWIRETGKNPLTPMSNSDVELLSKNTGNLSLNQPESSFRAALEAYERAYSNAYIGAGGRPDVLHPQQRKPAKKALPKGWSIEEAD